MKIISRKEAKELGLNRYFTGKPCPYGHIAERRVGNSGCFECIKIRRDANKENAKAYNKLWREANKEKERASGRRYREENPEKVREYNKEYYKSNKEIISQKNKEYRLSNKDKMEAYRAENKEKRNAQSKSWREANKQKVKAYNKSWHKDNPLQVFVRCTLQRIERAACAERINRAEVDIGYTQEEFIQHIESQFEDEMSWDNRSEWHVDHIVPVSKLLADGVTDIKIINALSNLQPLWASDNQSKGSKY